MLESEKDLRSYLLSAVCMQWKNQKRKYAWRNRIAPMADLKEEISIAAGDVLEGCLEEEERIAVRQAVAGLPDKYRIPVLLYYMKEMSVTEVAEVMHIPPGTVKSRLSAARKRLKAELEVLIVVMPSNGQQEDPQHLVCFLNVAMKMAHARYPTEIFLWKCSRRAMLPAMPKILKTRVVSVITDSIESPHFFLPVFLIL